MVRISVCRILASQNCDWVPVFEQFHSKHLNAENLISNRNMKIRENVHHLLGVFLCECVLNTNMALFNYSNSKSFSSVYSVSEDVLKILAPLVEVEATKVSSHVLCLIQNTVTSSESATQIIEWSDNFWIISPLTDSPIRQILWATFLSNQKRSLNSVDKLKRYSVSSQTSGARIFI